VRFKLALWTLSSVSFTLVFEIGEKMKQILQDRNLTTKFRILAEIARNQPNIQQKDIARRLQVTSQAISKYIKELLEDGWLISDGRSKYRVTKEGVNWLLKSLRELKDYSNFVEESLTRITVCAAVAASDISKGQEVGLEMRDGLLVATGIPGRGAKGIATSDARKGEDVGISDIEGIVELKPGKITILIVPNIQRGGSKKVDHAKLRKKLEERGLIGAVGLEALVALRQAGVEPDYLYGVAEAAIEAARCGLHFTIACTDDAVPALLKKLEDEGLNYELTDLSLIE